MKTIYYLFLVLLMGFFSCAKETIVPIESVSEDKLMKVTISASRSTSLDPWMLEIALTHAGTTSKVYQEFYANEVSDKNVSFQWESNTACLIQLTQRDGVVITVPVSADSGQ